MDVKRIIFLTAIIVIVTFPLILYFTYFNSGFSTSSNDWIAFATLYGSVSGALAFVAIIFSLVVSQNNFEKQHRQINSIQKEELIFKKVNVIHKAIGDEVGVLKGSNVFEHAIDKYVKCIQNQYVSCLDMYKADCISNMSEYDLNYVFYPFVCTVVYEDITDELTIIEKRKFCLDKIDEYFVNNVCEFLKGEYFYPFSKFYETPSSPEKYSKITTGLIIFFDNLRVENLIELNEIVFAQSNSNDRISLLYPNLVSLCRNIEHVINSIDADNSDFYMSYIRNLIHSEALIILFLYSITDLSSQLFRLKLLASDFFINASEEGMNKLFNKSIKYKSFLIKKIQKSEPLFNLRAYSSELSEFEMNCLIDSNWAE